MEGISTHGNKLIVSGSILSRANGKILEALEKARVSERGRYAIPLFAPESPTQALVNAFRKGTYVQPHLHHDKDEYFIPLQGEVVVATFGYNGELSALERRKPGETYSHVPPGIYHSAIPLTHEAVVLEVLNKPYVAETHKEGATWAPEENDERVPEFQRKLMQDISQRLNIPLPKI
jgi:cupin fold WbuC family metalloprotein